MSDEAKRFIATIQFDSIITFEEFQKIIFDLLKQDFELEILPHTIPNTTTIPYYSAWQLIVTKKP